MSDTTEPTGLRVRIMRQGGRAAQLLSHLCSGAFTGRLEAAFDGTPTWNGRRSCLLLSFDVVFPEDADVLPQLVEQLASMQGKASFAVVGRWVEDYPDEHRAVLEAGHELVNHSYSHPELVNVPGRFVSRRDDLNPRRWETLSIQEKAAEIAQCQQAVQGTLGVDLAGFRAPHFGNVDPRPLYPILNELGLSYSTSMLATRGRQLGVPVMEGDVVEIPVSTCPQHPLSSLDTWHGLYAHGGWHLQDFGEVLAQRLRTADASGGITNIYLDPKDVSRIDMVPVFEALADLRDDCWVATYSEFATWFRAECAT
ncbi:MAG: polysaccharide deacetylase family protein [Gemmatimonadetes bacterium]|nr:polysaccharide deacetylase family protein [Gemmatimonadota bacterium]